MFIFGNVYSVTLPTVISCSQSGLQPFARRSGSRRRQVTPPTAGARRSRTAGDRSSARPAVVARGDGGGGAPAPGSPWPPRSRGRSAPDSGSRRRRWCRWHRAASRSSPAPRGIRSPAKPSAFNALWSPPRLKRSARAIRRTRCDGTYMPRQSARRTARATATASPRDPLNRSGSSLPSKLPSPPRELPTMSLLNQAWIGIVLALAFFACAPDPMSPCSSPATVMNTSVASNSMPLSANTRASSIDSTVPLPSSFAPGASMS